jgi:purine nucleoside permease
MFEGEQEAWHDFFREAEVLPFSWGPGRLVWSRSQAVLGVVAGVGTVLAASTITALACDPRFDLTRAHWVLAGIAGGDPQETSLGSVVVPRWVVDCDLKSEIDQREAPQDWDTARLPLFRYLPFEQPPGPWRGESWKLSARGQRRVIEAASGVRLLDIRGPEGKPDDFGAYGAARLAPRVMAGDCLSGQTLWHGRLMTTWAREWVSYWTGGEGVFAATSMEDSGILRALSEAANAGLVTWRQVVLMRGICNFSEQPAGMSAVESLSRETPSGYSAFRPAVTNVHRVALAFLDSLPRSAEVTSS